MVMMDLSTNANLIIIMADNSQRNEILQSDLLHVFILENIKVFMDTTLTTSWIITAYFIVFSMCLLKVIIVNPVMELMNFVCVPSSAEKV